MHVDLGAVEGSIALVDRVGEAVAVQRSRQRRLAAIPQLVGPDPLLRPGRELEPDVDVEDPVGGEGELEHARDLILDLVLGAEQVRVVLSEVTYPEETVEGSAGLP